MSIAKKWAGKLIRTVCNLYQGNGLSQASSQAEGEPIAVVDAAAVMREAAAEGIVLLQNDGVLPLAPDTRVALFGRCQYNWFYVGNGSGGDVNLPYKINLIDACNNRVVLDEELAARYQKWCASYVHAPDEGWWGAWPRSHPEMPISDKDVQRYAAKNDVAVYVIGRSAGEDRENVLEEGAYYLTKQERILLDKLHRHFAKTVVVLDVGNVMDMAWVKHYPIGALLVAYFGGQEGTNALVDVLTGAVNPSGKLTDTVAEQYTDYPSAGCFGNRDGNFYQEDIYVGYRYFETFAPEKVLFPFGYGGSYTQFSWQVKNAACTSDGASVTVAVQNVGQRAGKEVMQLYVQAPQGKLGKSARVLVAFAKTELLAPNQTQELVLSCTRYDMASYDDTGATGHAHCYVLEEGTYTFWVGNSVRNTQQALQLALDSTQVLCRLQEICAVDKPFDRLVPQLQNGHLTPAYRPVKMGQRDLRRRILDNMPREVPTAQEAGIVWQDVVDGSATVEQFAQQLSMEELEALTRGEGNIHSALGVKGNGGAMAGVSEALRARGVPAVITCDGPSGLRINRYCNLAPSGAAVGAGWNLPLTQTLFAAIGQEVAAHNAHVLLGPGMNIHRNPLCGRNFEYFSEDPVVSGLMGAAVVKGVQSAGVAACVKHFCCNNQEYNRSRNDSRVSCRALREIYLKGFEIAIKTADPWTIMTSYNLVNGVWSHYNYDLATTVLRQEWGYQGLVMTDWWMQHAASREFYALHDNAYRVRAGVDVYMPGSFVRTERGYRSDGTLLSTYGQPDGITRAEILRCAVSCLRLALRVQPIIADSNR